MGGIFFVYLFVGPVMLYPFQNFFFDVETIDLEEGDCKWVSDVVKLDIGTAYCLLLLLFGSSKQQNRIDYDTSRLFNCQLPIALRMDR